MEILHSGDREKMKILVILIIASDIKTCRTFNDIRLEKATLTLLICLHRCNHAYMHYAKTLYSYF